MKKPRLRYVYKIEKEPASWDPSVTLYSARYLKPGTDTYWWFLHMGTNWVEAMGSIYNHKVFVR